MNPAESRLRLYFFKGGDKVEWIEIGTVFPCRDGKGLDVVFERALPVGFQGPLTLRSVEPSTD